MKKRMPRKDALQLTEEDLQEFVRQRADFRFEMDTLKVLREEGFDTDHAATYVDPLSAKIRAYDLRARWISGTVGLRLAVECKNLHPSSPILLHATPREPVEAFYVLLRRTAGNTFRFNSEHRESGSSRIYRAGEPVGRQIDQPLKDDHGFKSSDGPTFDKWTQAVNGSFELLKQAVDDPANYPSLQAVIPVLVVPDGCLWQVDYDGDGNITCSPRLVGAAELILRHTWSVPANISSLNYEISHLEIVTISALPARIAQLRNKDGLFFNVDDVLRHL